MFGPFSPCEVSEIILQFPCNVNCSARLGYDLNSLICPRFISCYNFCEIDGIHYMCREEQYLKTSNDASYSFLFFVFIFVLILFQTSVSEGETKVQSFP